MKIPVSKATKRAIAKSVHRSKIEEAVADERERCAKIAEAGIEFDGKGLPVADVTKDDFEMALDAFSKATSMPGGPSLAMQRHDPTWEAWKKLCDTFTAHRKPKSTI